MRRICFVTNEIYPTTAGGAGFLIHNLSWALLERDCEIILLLDLSRADFDRFQQVDRLTLPNPLRCRAYWLRDLCADLPLQEKDFLSRHIWDAYRIDAACRQVYARERPELIEFVDYTGQAYYALIAKVCGLSYQHSHLAVRLHATVELIDQSAPGKPADFNRYSAYALERASWRLAESLLTAVPSYVPAYYQDKYPPPFGEIRPARPPLLSHPDYQEPGASADTAMFYGQLSTLKGADLFVEAALQYLATNPDTELRFALVGRDSMEPPITTWGSYQEYLESKIPPNLRERFLFTGYLQRNELQVFLQRVKFAVIPTYFESFCYAAHELRQAGVPLVLSSIPALRDGFQDETEALFFDGTPGDLAAKIERLEGDMVLRKVLARKPDPPPDGDLSFYLAPPSGGWIRPAGRPAESGLLLLILIDLNSQTALNKTLNCLTALLRSNDRVVLLHEQATASDKTDSVTLFGKAYRLTDRDGQPVVVQSLCTGTALLVLRSGDEVQVDFVQAALDTLDRHEQISFVSAWKAVISLHGQWINTHPLAAMLELAPCETSSLFNRCVMRTPAGVALGDLLDIRLQQYAEIGYLWHLEDDQTCGVQIPAVWISQQAELVETTGGTLLAYLLQKEQYRPRLQRLASYLGALVTAYPVPLLPVQQIWAAWSGYPTGESAPGQRSIIVKPGWRRRLYLRLKQGGSFSQRILAGLSWGWFRLKKLR